MKHSLFAHKIELKQLWPHHLQPSKTKVSGTVGMDHCPVLLKGPNTNLSSTTSMTKGQILAGTVFPFGVVHESE